MKSSKTDSPVDRFFSRAAPSFGRSAGVALALFTGLALVVNSMSASAATADVTVSVAPVVTPVSAGQDPSITYSYAANVFAPYTVFIQNNTNSPINNLWFRIRTETLTTPGGAVLTSKLALYTGVPGGGTCSPDPTQPVDTGLVCVFPSVAPGSAPLTFGLKVTPPVEPSPAVPSVLTLLYTVQAGQGAENPSSGLTRSRPPVVVTLGSAADVRTYVDDLVNGLKVSDGSSNTVVTPPEPATVGIAQSNSDHSCSPHYKTCLESKLSITDAQGSAITFQNGLIVIDLFRANSTLKKGAKISNLKLYYVPDGTTTMVPILECIPGDAPLMWKLPDGTARCVVPATKPPNLFTYEGATGWFIRVLATTNGIIQW
jgi:hypothetical protein